MGSTPSNLEEDSPELEQGRSALSATSPPVLASDHDAVFALVRAQAEREQSSFLAALSAKATGARQLLVIAVLAVIVAVELGLHARDAFAMAPVRVGVSLAAFGGLMLIVLMSSLRPMHQPALSQRTERLLVVGPLLVAIGLSLWPTLDGTLGGASGADTSCLLYGLAVAIPVYVTARILDRGAWVTGLLATLGAGLSANFVLMTHCPTAGTDHMLAGHFGVIVAMLLAYAAWSRLRLPQTH